MFPGNRRRIRWGFFAGLIALGLVVCALLPVPGRVLLVPDNWPETGVWPRIAVVWPPPGSDQPARVVVTDNTPWAYIYATVDGKEAQFERSDPFEQDTGFWNWYWTFLPPDVPTYDIVFYRDCNTGCIERGRVTVGPPTTPPKALNPPRNTKLGVVFANPARDWHGRSGWDVELTYAALADVPEERYWGVHGLAERVADAHAKGLRVLVRVDYDRGQSLPAADDYEAFNLYLKYVQRLARDQRLDGVYAYIIGSGFNAAGSNQAYPARPVTPAWYARIFNGYGVEPGRSDNVVETMRAENALVRVLVGPVRPWVNDLDGEEAYHIDVPWLNYMNTLVAALSASAEAKAVAGVPLAAPDGFAVQASGRPEAPELAGRPPAEEPYADLARPAWQGAQAGFRVYEDWLAIINSYPHTQGLPVFISSTNTFTPDTDIPPAQNYPPGWLHAALDVVNDEPQVWALCWFIDGSVLDTQWELYRLAGPQGLLVDAADEFDELLQHRP
ncbi:MAG: hypothetical protein ACOYYS_08850 [Chloroflexota bacterium]